MEAMKGFTGTVIYENQKRRRWIYNYFTISGLGIITDHEM